MRTPVRPLDWNRDDPEPAPVQDPGLAPRGWGVQGRVVSLPTPSAGGRTEASSTQRSPGLDARATERQHAHARDREVAVDSPSSPPGEGVCGHWGKWEAARRGAHRRQNRTGREPTGEKPA